MNQDCITTVRLTQMALGVIHAAKNIHGVSVSEFIRRAVLNAVQHFIDHGTMPPPAPKSLLPTPKTPRPNPRRRNLAQHPDNQNGKNWIDYAREASARETAVVSGQKTVVDTN